MKVLILRGLPASGKSTFARKFVKENPDYVRVNRDDLRRMRGKYWMPKQEQMITEWEIVCTKVALESGYNVVLDSTNLNEKHLKSFKWRVDQKCLVEFEEKFLDTPVWLCIIRDFFREHKVGHKVILRMYKQYIQQ